MHHRFGLRGVLAPRAIGILKAHQPIPGPHGGVEVALVTGLLERTTPSQDDLTGVENRRRPSAPVATIDAGLNRPGRELNLELPISHAYGARVELVVRGATSVIEKRRDDVPGRLRVRRQPASEE